VQKPNDGCKMPPAIDLTEHPAGGHLFTVPFGSPFLKTLADAVLSGHLPPAATAAPDTLALPDLTILVPTRRAVRALSDAFLESAGQGALLLPQIRPISQTDEDLSLLTNAASHDLGGDAAFELPPAVDELERQLLLIDLIQTWAETSDQGAVTLATPAQAAKLARELATLMDLVETENVPLDGLKALVPDEFARHWQATLSFLQILIRQWPDALARRGRLSPADRRNRLILAEAERLASASPTGPVIVAGVSGSVPATAALMRTVLSLDNGAIVLPGVDQNLDDESRRLILPGCSLAHSQQGHPEHPQHGILKVAESLRARLDSVRDLAGAVPAPHADLRAQLLSEAMRPPATTAQWRSFGSRVKAADLEAALQDMTLIEAQTAQDEAEVVALIMRQCLETPCQTAALVSPDRVLARRVGARLKAWGIDVDDSAGRPFRKTPPGALIDLILQVLETHFSPHTVMALLKHPLVRLQLQPGEMRRRARNLEIVAFRTVYLGRGLADIRVALEKAHDDVTQRRRRERAVRLMNAADWRNTFALLNAVEAAFTPLQELARKDRPVSLRALVNALVATAEALSRPPPNGHAGQQTDVPESSHSQDQRPLNQQPTDLPELIGHPEQTPLIWHGHFGETAADLLSRLLVPELPDPKLSYNDFPEFLRALVAHENVRSGVSAHSRLSIWGPYEARLMTPDVVILGSLNDGTWPQIAQTGPWLNRPMRAELGLPAPEEAIGRAAHDFVQLCAAPKVYMTRSERVDGAPTVASRWLLRLRAVLSGIKMGDALAPERPWLAWAAAREATQSRITLDAPAPCPPLDLRPKRLSVSDVETWIANPYALYARKILELEPLPELGQAPDAALKGAIVHMTLGRFANTYCDALPDDITAALMDIVRDVIADYARHPAVSAFWVPRFARFADWFAQTEPQRRAHVERSCAEVPGRIDVPGTQPPLTLTARADRIDLAGHSAAIYDYKGTRGLAELARRAKDLRAPQLPLEAAILMAGGFDGLADMTPARLAYISTAGGDPPGDEQALVLADIAATATAAIEDLARLANRFADPNVAYRAIRRGQFDYRYDQYALLARVLEWRATADQDAEDGT